MMEWFESLSPTERSLILTSVAFLTYLSGWLIHYRKWWFEKIRNIRSWHGIDELDDNAYEPFNSQQQTREVIQLTKSTSRPNGIPDEQPEPENNSYYVEQSPPQKKTESIEDQIRRNPWEAFQKLKRMKERTVQFEAACDKVRQEFMRTSDSIFAIESSQPVVEYHSCVEPKAQATNKDAKADNTVSYRSDCFTDAYKTEPSHENNNSPEKVLKDETPHESD